MKTTIEVTAEDIAEGVVLDCQNCPVATAVARARGPWDEVTIRGWKGNYYARFVSVPRSAFAYLPAKARGFIREFDRGYSGEPFAFELDIPEMEPAVS